MPLFGKKKKAPAAKESIAKLRETIDMLEKREQFLQKKMDKEVADAKKYMQQKNKRGTLHSLNQFLCLREHFIVFPSVNLELFVH
jgi:charged multivesicular body protein 4